MRLDRAASRTAISGVSAWLMRTQEILLPLMIDSDFMK
jgi:hypothetical protein